MCYTPTGIILQAGLEPRRGSSSEPVQSPFRYAQRVWCRCPAIGVFVFLGGVLLSDGVPPWLSGHQYSPVPPVLASFWHWAFRDCRRALGALVRMQVLGAPGPLLFEGGPGGVWTQGPGLLGNRPRFPEKGLIRLSGCLGCWTGVSGRICPSPGPGRGSQGEARPIVWRSFLNPAVSTSPRRGQHGWRCWAGGGGVVLRA